MNRKIIISLIITGVLLSLGYLGYKNNLMGVNRFFSKSFHKIEPKYRTNLINKYVHDFEIHGIDVSKHQGTIDWSKLKHYNPKKKIDFVFIRSSVGLKKDESFDRNWRNARVENLKIGAYHYYWSNVNSSAQASIFMKHVNLIKGDLPPVLDIEKLPKIQSKENWRKGLKNWLRIIENHYGTKPIIYTGDNFFRHHLKQDPFFKNYPRLWIANYNPVKQPINNWIFWQYSEKVKISGIKELVDANVFKYDLLTFNKLLIK